MKKLYTKLTLAVIFIFLFSGFSHSQNDVYLQGFYWNSTPGGTWYDSLSNIAAHLKSSGFKGIWIPPAAKGGGSMSMGYDIYDNYDFGEYNQKGTTRTRFGNRAQLVNMVSVYRQLGMQLYFDLVMNHQGNANLQAAYTCGGGTGWVIFNPASGRFPKRAEHFHPNTIHCDNTSPYHNKIFFEDICQHSSAGDSLIEWGKYIINELKFDGFRIDAIKHIEPDFIARFSQAFPGKYIVGEHWSGENEIQAYYNQVVSFGGSVSIYDFPLRYALRDMCNNASGSYNMNNLTTVGLRGKIPMEKVSTFVENHDVDRVNWDGQISDGHDPITRDKMMAYAYIMFVDGRPTVFYRDYFQYGLRSKIDTLIYIRNNFLSGNVLFANSLNVTYLNNASNVDLFIAKRNGNGNIPGGILLLNDNPNTSLSAEISTGWNNTVLKDFTGNSPNLTTNADGRVVVSVKPRGYAVYVPNTGNINRPPVITPVDTIKTFAGTHFNYSFIVSDADNDSVTITFENIPPWITVQNKTIFGLPDSSHLGVYSNLKINANDGKGGTASAVFTLKVSLSSIGSLVFNIDGILDASAIQAATNNGEHLWYGWNGTELYLATEKADAASDKFIFAALQPGALTTHPWVKNGSVALWRFFLGNEGTNSWAGFTGLLSTTPNEIVVGSVLESKLNIVQELGSIPQGIYLAAAKYQTPNNGILTNQVPNGNGDGNIDASEYIYIPLGTLSSKTNYEVVSDFVLHQNYPNPFNPSTVISWRTAAAGRHALKIYDMLGSTVTVLVDEIKEAGSHSIEFDGSLYTSGVYFYRLVANGFNGEQFIATKKLLLIK